MTRLYESLTALLLTAALTACSSGSATVRDAPTEQAAVATSPASDTGPRQVEVPIAEGAVLWAEARGAADAPRTLVVLHGGPGLSHHYTRPLLELAGEELQVIVFDQRGVGASTPMDVAEYTLTNQAADLEALRAHFGLEQMLVLGHSWGGLVGMAYATAHPERVSALILVDSAPPDTDTLLATLGDFERRVAALIERGLISAQPPAIEGDDCTASLVSVLPAYFHDPEHEDTKHLGGSTCHATVLGATQRNSEGFDYREALARLDTPSVIFHGASDPFGLAGVEATATSLGDALRAKVILEQCGHIPWEECPEPFLTELERFLSAPASYTAP